MVPLFSKTIGTGSQAQNVFNYRSIKDNESELIGGRKAISLFVDV